MSNLTVCGTDCSKCGAYGSMCKGCTETQGKVFHCAEGKACAIYTCAVEEKKYADCSNCSELPCSVWKATRDPSYSDEEFEANIQNRIHNFTEQR